MTRHRRDFILGSLLAGFLVTSCSEQGSPTSPTSDASVVGNTASHELSVLSDASSLKSCGHASRMAMRFGAPGYVTGTTAGMFLKATGVPAGRKTLRVWWDWENAPEKYEDFSLADEDSIDELIEHLYENGSAGDVLMVRAELIVDGQSGECIRVREIELNDAAPRISAPKSPCNGGSCTVFATSTTYQGDFGGLAAADGLCQSRAAAAGIKGTFKAWLSDATGSPSTRFQQSPTPYVLVDATQVATDWADLTDGALAHPINLTELNGGLAKESVWTGTGPDGTAGGGNCNNWTSTAGTAQGGVTNASNLGWTNNHTPSCLSFPSRLYCFQQ